MMDRREFLSTSMAPALAGLRFSNPDDFRAQFPRLAREVYLNLASMAPLGRFADQAIASGLDQQRVGPARGGGDYAATVRREIRGLFARLVGATEEEIGLVHCTKAGEQIAIGGVMDRLRAGGNIVTNDLHFGGSLHNLVGLRHAGIDVRIVKARDWRVEPERMAEAMDGQTALVCASLVSNVNGHLEDFAAIASQAHAHGALVYADIIQAAGTIPVDVRALDVDVAACSAYKYLFGIYGTGFLYVRSELQGSGALPDGLYPGFMRQNYTPWTAAPDPALDEFPFQAPVDATRYQPGHISYAGYCAAYEGLRILLETGIPTVHAHARSLNRLLIESLPPEQFRLITPDPDRVAQAVFLVAEPEAVGSRLRASNVITTLAGNRLRVSPGLFNNEADVAAMVEVLLA